MFGGIYIKNQGKIFEDCFKKSIPEEHVLVKRLNDNAAAWSGGENTRFASTNECDFILYDDDSRTLYGLELKSTQGNSFTFWREDFEDKTKKQSFMIKKKQILGLNKWGEHKGVFGIIFNFRNHNNKTYFVYIDKFIKYTAILTKKSINLYDVLHMQPVEIKNEMLRTNYRYDIEAFLNETSI